LESWAAARQAFRRTLATGLVYSAAGGNDPLPPVSTLGRLPRTADSPGRRSKAEDVRRGRQRQLGGRADAARWSEPGGWRPRGCLV